MLSTLTLLRKRPAVARCLARQPLQCMLVLLTHSTQSRQCTVQQCICQGCLCNQRCALGSVRLLVEASGSAQQAVHPVGMLHPLPACRQGSPEPADYSPLPPGCANRIASAAMGCGEQAAMAVATALEAMLPGGAVLQALLHSMDRRKVAEEAALALRQLLPEQANPTGVPPCLHAA